MAKSWQYSDRRRVISQMVMAVILCSTLGGAALVVHHKATAEIVPLGDYRTVGKIRVKLPAKWELKQGDSVYTLVEPDRPGDDDQSEDGIRKGRVMTLKVNRVSTQMTLDDFIESRAGLLRVGILRPLWDKRSPPIELTIAGAPGVLRSYKPIAINFFGDETARRPDVVWVAAAILPDGTGIFLALVSPDEIFTPQDRRLMENVARSITRKGS